MPQFLALLHRVCRPTVAAATADAATAAVARRPAMPSQPVFPPNLACFSGCVFDTHKYMEFKNVNTIMSSTQVI